MKILLTGASGFLGWRARLRLKAVTDHEVVIALIRSWSGLVDAVAIIPIDGVNPAKDDMVRERSEDLARDVVAAMPAGSRPVHVFYVDSIQDGNDTAHGLGKAQACEILAAASEATGGPLVYIRLANLFGEHGRPGHNSSGTNFVETVRDGSAPTVNDIEVGRLQGQGAANALNDGLTGEVRRIDPPSTPVTVRGVLDLLREFKVSYDTGEFPDLSTPFRVDLFNTYRAALFPDHYPFALTPHTDPRGTFAESIRVRGGEGQAPFSTTVPGITRGEYFHLRKVERFAVIAGEARISLRKMFTDEVVDSDVTGAEPCAIEKPVGCVHNIRNTGTEALVTQFWSHELHRPEDPDTYSELARPQGATA